MNKPSIVYGTADGKAPSQALMSKKGIAVHVAISFPAGSDPATVIHNMQLEAGETPLLRWYAARAGKDSGLPVFSFPDGNTVEIAGDDLALDLWISGPETSADTKPPKRG